MGEITFIRHGQASFGQDDYDVLSERGREQSELLAQYLADCGINFDAAYCGTLNRQKDTADIILQRLGDCGRVKVPGLVQDEGLNEYHSDALVRHYIPLLINEDRSVSRLLESIHTDKRSFQLIFEKVIGRWLSGESTADDVETWESFRQRVDASIRLITDSSDRGGNVVVFSSGGVISTAVQIATGISPEAAIRMGWELVNSSMTKFRFSGSGVTLHTFNSYPHFELNRLKELITYR